MNTILQNSVIGNLPMEELKATLAPRRQVALHARACQCESLSETWSALAEHEKLAAGPSTVLCLDFSENLGDLYDFVQEYADGKMAAEAKAVYEAILENGSLDTVRLRREARMSAESGFDRALVELQVGLKVLPIGVARTGAWNYAFNYELFQRWFPEVPEQARGVKRSEGGAWWCCATLTTSSPRTGR